MKFLTKRSVILSTLTLSLLVAWIFVVPIIGTCSSDLVCTVLVDILGYDFPEILLFIPFLILFPALVSLPMNNFVFENWKKFSIWAVPILIILSYLIIRREESMGGGFMSVEIGPIIIGILYAIYSLVSLLIIGVTWYRNREKSAVQSGKF